MRFQNKVCLITGAGSGIGRATSIRFAREGALVVVVDHHEEGDKTVAEIEKSNGKAVFVKGDVSEEQEVRLVVKAAVDRWQKIDVIVNNAAMMTFKPIVDLTIEEWDQVQNVNMRSVFLFCKYGLPYVPEG